MSAIRALCGTKRSAIVTIHQPRKEIFITTKIPCGKGTTASALHAINEDISQLATPYVDLLLIHSPKLGEAKTVELWRALVEAKRRGRARAIGVSNFNWAEVEALERATGELPELQRQSVAYDEARREAGLASELLPLAGLNHFSIMDELEAPDGALATTAARLARRGN